MSMELDQLDNLAASVFDGYLVRKDLVRKYSRQYPVPTYVVEFLLGRYCASVNESEIAEGLEIVEKQLKDRTVRTGEGAVQGPGKGDGIGQDHRHSPRPPGREERLLCRGTSQSESEGCPYR